MTPTLFTHPLAGLLMIGMPVALGIYIARRFKLGWRIWWIGAATFVLSQVGHIPFNWLVDRAFRVGWLPVPPLSWALWFNAIFLGLSAGLWEELARAAVYRWWATDARSWGKGVQLGAGHGGSEAIILGGLVVGTFVYMLAIRGMDPALLAPPEQIELARQQISAYWSAPWPLTLLSAVERAFTIPLHLACSVLVLQAFTRRQPAWVGLAILWHALADGLLVYFQGAWAGYSWTPYALEGLVGVSGLASIAILFVLRRPEPPAEPVEEEVVLPPAGLVDRASIAVEVSQESLDRSRYM